MRARGGNEREKPVIPASAPSEEGPDNCTDNGTDSKETNRATSAPRAFPSIFHPPNQLSGLHEDSDNIAKSRCVHRRQVGKEGEPLGRSVSSGSFLAPAG